MKGYFRRRGCTCEKTKKKCTCGAKWSFTIDIGIDPATGKRKQKTVSGFDTKAKAEEAATTLHYELNQGTYVEESGVTFKEFSLQWLQLYESTGKVKVSTVRVRKKERNLLLPYFGHLKMKDITKKMYQDALIDLKNKGYADNSLAGTHSTGRMIFKNAIEMEVIKNDPSQFARVPKVQKSVEQIESEEEEVKYLEKDELSKFLKTAKENGMERDYPIFWTLAYTGMRVGEICALKWKDIDFDESTISITKTCYNPNNNAMGYQLLTPKTKTSQRVIEVDQSVIAALEDHKKKQKEVTMKYRTTYYDKDFVFAKVTEEFAGYPEFASTIRERMNRLLKLAKLNQKLSPHSLRHTHTSLLAEAGVSLDEIMERLGHKDDSTTKFVYMHTTKPMKKKAAQKFSELMKSL